MHQFIGFCKLLAGILASWHAPQVGLDPIKSQAQVAIALSFGSKALNQSNRVLAKICMGLQAKHNLPLILQQEVYCAGYGLRCYAIGSPHHKYIDTHEVLRVARDICKMQGWQRIVLVCHPDHFWRAKRTVEKLGLQVVFVPPEIAKVPYALDDPQPWVRNAQNFRLREILSRIFFLFKGYLSFG